MLVVLLFLDSGRGGVSALTFFVLCLLCVSCRDLRYIDFIGDTIWEREAVNRNSKLVKTGGEMYANNYRQK